MAGAHFYRVGKRGVAWGDAERAEWLSDINTPQRSYRKDVLERLAAHESDFEVLQYGALSIDPERYPLYYLQSRKWEKGRPCVLITGGTHGYETSGVQGALLFLESGEAKRYASRGFNIVVVPCVSPWAYECVQRWNCKALDPNRNYLDDSPVEECAAVMRLLRRTLGVVAQWAMHLDLHETTDTDDTEFRPAKAARDGENDLEDEGGIPDGFYLIGDIDGPQPEWHAAMIAAVAEVTHIAPADANGNIVGLKMAQPGVVNSKRKGKGKGATNAPFVSTTEVYPDSKATPVTSDQCNRAQVACITAGLDYLAQPGVLDKSLGTLPAC